MEAVSFWSVTSPSLIAVGDTVKVGALEGEVVRQTPKSLVVAADGRSARISRDPRRFNSRLIRLGVREQVFPGSAVEARRALAASSAPRAAHEYLELARKRYSPQGCFVEFPASDVTFRPEVLGVQSCSFESAYGVAFRILTSLYPHRPAAHPAVHALIENAVTRAQ